MPLYFKFSCKNLKDFVQSYTSDGYLVSIDYQKYLKIINLYLSIKIKETGNL